MIKDKVKELKKIKIEQIKPCQENLKTITFKNLQRLKNSIKQNGFSAPLFVWWNEEVKKYDILDGHQRFLAINELIREDKISVKDIPCVIIESEDKKSAKKLLLSLSSQFGTHSKLGFEEFLEQNEIDISDVEFNFPEIDIFSGERQHEQIKERKKIGEEKINNPNYEGFNIVVICQDEDEQEKIYNKLKETGLNIRII